MDLQEYISRLKEYGVQDSPVTLVIAPNGKILLANIKKRIFKEGVSSEGSEIGQYSTEPIYVSRRDFAKPASYNPNNTVQDLGTVYRKGKVFQRKRKRKNMFIPGGYKQLREIQSMPVDNVKIRYRGRTQRAYVMSAYENEVLLGLNTPLAAYIKGKMEDKFKVLIFRATGREMDEYKSRVSARMEVLTRNTIKGITTEPIIETPTEDNLIDYGIV